MLNFSKAKRAVIAMTGGILSSLMISTPVLAEAEIILRKSVSDCSIYYSGLADSLNCRRYVVTYHRESETYAHHFIFDSSGRKSIMLFSPDSWVPGGKEVMSKITSVTINNNGKKVRAQGNGRCKLNVSLVSCNFYEFKTDEILNVNVKF